MAEYDFEITQRPDFALLAVRLQAGQQIQAEPAAMATMDTNINMKSGLKGGLMASAGRMLGGESLIMNTFTAEGGSGEVTFAPGPPGDMVHYDVSSGNSIMLQRGAYVASGMNVDVSGKWDGARGFFSGEGMVLLQATGNGDLFFNTYGGILEVDVTGEYYVDTGYIVAFESTLNYNVTVLPGLTTGGKIKSFLFGGEGLVCRFQGRGKLWIQTRCAGPFVQFVNPFRPAKNKN
jgi:uncharacterized protein (TIGR00266 family)